MIEKIFAVLLGFILMTWWLWVFIYKLTQSPEGRNFLIAIGGILLIMATFVLGFFLISKALGDDWIYR